LFGKHAS
jgi:IS30 family transposase